MVQKKVDARGMACPQPVIETRRALEDDAVHMVKVLVDNDPAVENVTRTGRSLGCEVQVDDRGNGEVEITLTRGEKDPLSRDVLEAKPKKEGPEEQQVAVLMASDTIGRGDDELGRILTVAFVKTLAAMTPMPKTLVFLNSGVKLTTKGSPLIGAIKELEDRGAEVMSCGTCLDFYGLKESLEVGVISNMFDIVSALASADKTIRP
jgi:selenium metabolism protein YedF